MGPEVEYFPNVSAVCGTLRLNAIISAPALNVSDCDGDEQQADRWATALSPGKSAAWPGSGATSSLCRREPWSGWGPMVGLRVLGTDVTCALVS